MVWLYDFSGSGSFVDLSWIWVSDPSSVQSARRAKLRTVILPLQAQHLVFLRVDNHSVVREVGRSLGRQPVFCNMLLMVICWVSPDRLSSSERHDSVPAVTVHHLPKICCQERGVSAHAIIFELVFSADSVAAFFFLPHTRVVPYLFRFSICFNRFFL